MATNDPFAGLSTQDLLQLFQSGGALPNGMHAIGYGSQGGMQYGQDANPGATTLGGYSAYDPAHFSPGDSMYDYDASGNYTGTHKIDADHNLRNFALSILAMFGGAAALGAAGSAGAAGTLGEGWAGAAGSAGAGSLGGAATGGAVGGVGGLSSGVGYMNGADIASDLATSSGYGSAGGSSLAASTLTPEAAAGSYGTLTGPAALATPGVSSAATGGLLSSAASALGISPGIAGLGAAALGAIAGSKPQQTKVDQARTPWAPLIPYLTGDNGLFNSAQKLFQQQTGASQDAGQAMQQRGLALMGAPVAGNGYSQFASMPRYGAPGRG